MLAVWYAREMLAHLQVLLAGFHACMASMHGKQMLHEHARSMCMHAQQCASMLNARVPLPALPLLAALLPTLPLAWTHLQHSNFAHQLLPLITVLPLLRHAAVGAAGHENAAQAGRLARQALLLPMLATGVTPRCKAVSMARASVQRLSRCAHSVHRARRAASVHRPASTQGTRPQVGVLGYARGSDKTTCAGRAQARPGEANQG